MICFVTKRSLMTCACISMLHCDSVNKSSILTCYEKENELKAKVIAKLEYFNPLGSVKDRVAGAMIEQGIKDGKINVDTVIIEPTSGNTGIGLAFVAAAKGLHLILTMPDTMSVERRKIVSALGAEIVLTPGREGMKGAIAKAEALKEEYGNAFIPQQFENEANPEIHKKTTGQEIWRDIFLLPYLLYNGRGLYAEKKTQNTVHGAYRGNDSRDGDRTWRLWKKERR